MKQYAKETMKANKEKEVESKKPEMTPEVKAAKAWNRKVNKVIKLKEKKFGLRYTGCESLPEYRSYRLFAQSMTYGEYRHKASFYGIPVLKRNELFKWYQMFFEVKTDCVLMQDNAPSKEGYAKNIPKASASWTPKELKVLRDYVLNWSDPLKKA